jgi:hypothetical protein
MDHSFLILLLGLHLQVRLAKYGSSSNGGCRVRFSLKGVLLQLLLQLHSKRWKFLIEKNLLP